MDYQSKYYIPTASEEMVTKLEKLRRYFKQCLREMGCGSNRHIYSLKDDEIFLLKARQKYPFLMKVISFYEHRLDKWEKNYFTIEILEKGEYYRYWYTEVSARVFTGNEKRALAKIEEELFDEGTPF